MSHTWRGVAVTAISSLVFAFGGSAATAQPASVTARTAVASVVEAAAPTAQSSTGVVALVGRDANGAARSSTPRAGVKAAFPVLFILGVLARFGIRYVIRWYGKTQLKKAAKSFLLTKVNANKWGHILQQKHRWDLVGARSREQVAEIMSSAMANGRHSAYGAGAMKAEWVYKGRTIVVTYAKKGGQISDGWVKTR